MSGLYRIPAAHFRARAVLSNTPPTIPYRSAGRPEAMFVIERLIDMACDLHGFDPVKLRRRNLIRSDELPYRNPTGVTYDNGEYERVMDRRACSSANGTASPSGGARPRSAASCAASGSPITSNSPWAIRASAPK